MKQQLPQKCTKKKIKFQGVKDFVNVETGEITQMQFTSVEDRDFNFSKVWLKNFITSLDIIGNQKTRLAFWVVDHLNKENQITLNYRQIAEKTKMSYKTVATTMRQLQECDFLRKVGSAYTVNPDIYFKGTHNARLIVAQEYLKTPAKTISKEQRIKNLKNSIAGLTAQLTKLEAQDAIDADVDTQLAFDENGNIIERAR